MGKTLKVGDRMSLQVQQEQIDQSIPCHKGKCMLTLAFLAVIERWFGPGNYNVRSTNHGLTFDLDGQRYVCVFNHKTGDYIYRYDETYRKTRSAVRARATVKPFTAKLMVESRQRKPVFPPMSEETKAKLAAYPKDKRKVGTRTVSNRRQLSL